MASRYLATVRRATGTPVAFRVSARRASDSGLRGSSASIRRRIIAWMAVLEASPPPPVSMPEAKKARSGNVPRGVRTYLRAIAREIGRLVQADFAGDFAQGQRPQRLVAEFQERRLLPQQAAHHLEQRVAARFQALEQPARFLQVAAQVDRVGLAGRRIMRS